MPVTETRFDKLVSRVDDISGRLSKVEGAHAENENPKNRAPGWLPLVSTAVGLLVSILAVAVTITLHIDGEFSTIRKDASDLGSRTTKAEAAIKALTDQQSDQTQKLVHDLLATAKNAPQPQLAVRAAQTAVSLTSQLAQNKRPASNSFFKATFDDVEVIRQSNDPMLKTVAYAAQQQIAEYRSALTSQPKLSFSLVGAQPANGPLEVGSASGTPTTFEVGKTGVKFSRMLHAGFIWPNTKMIGAAFRRICRLRECLFAKG